jgi:ATP-dependent DNA helicase DinG
VFDEAHQLAEAGVQFLGTTLGSGQVIDFARDMLGIGLQQARGLAPWQDLAAACDRAARELRIACAGPLRDVRGTLKLRWDERAARSDFGEALAHRRACEPRASARHGERARARFRKLANAPRSWRRSPRASATRADRQRALDRPHAAPGRLVESPLDIRERCASRWRARRRPGSSPRRRSATTSAELVHRVGRLDDAPRCASAARSTTRATRGCTCRARSRSRTSRASGAVARWRPIARGARRPQLRADHDAAARCRPSATACARPSRAAGDDIRVLQQGQAPKRQLMQQFLAEPRLGAGRLAEFPGKASTCPAMRCSAC